jgi:hypothetical protein
VVEVVPGLAHEQGSGRIERTLAWIAMIRRGVRDDETLPAYHEAVVHIAMIMAIGGRRRRPGAPHAGAARADHGLSEASASGASVLLPGWGDPTTRRRVNPSSVVSTVTWLHSWW